MQLPNNNTSIIEDAKIINYLLNLEHPIGSAKAKFFLNFGFKVDDPEEFKEALKTHGVEREVVKEKSNDFGTKYELSCDLNTPDGRNPCIVTVWIIETDTIDPRLVTAYPDKKK